MLIPPLPLASNQEAIWHDQTAYPESPLYNIGGSLIISGEVNYPILNQAVKQLIDENDTLRIYITDQLPIRQNLLNDLKFQLEFIDFSGHSSPEKAAKNWLDQVFQEPFSLNKKELLWRFALIKESEQRYYLLTKYHHVIADGWAVNIVIARMTEIYNAFLKNQTVDTKPPGRYFNFIEKEQSYLNSPAYQLDYQFWATVIPEIPTPLVPRRYPTRSESSLPKSNIHRFKIKRTFYNQINDFALANKSTSYHIFLTALANYFSHIYQRKKIIIGVPSLNRSGAQYKDVVGLFISLSPLVLEIKKDHNSYQTLQNCKSSIRKLYRHHRFPLSETNKRLKLLQSGIDTLFDIILSYEKQEFSSCYGNASIHARQHFSGVSRYPLAVTICEFGDIDDVEVIFEGAENCFTAEDLDFLADRIQLSLQNILKHPETSINDLNFLTSNDKEIIYQKFNRPIQPKKSLPSVIQLFQQHVTQQPSKIAVEYNNQSLSYQQLDHLSTQLANHLFNQGIKPNDIVALCIPRNIEMIIGLMAVLKASAAYLPIPIDIPNQRISTILQQSKAVGLLTISQSKNNLSKLHNRIICIDTYQEEDHHHSITPVIPRIEKNTLAYIIFTSGSTGSPKGVIIDHTALSLRIHWLQSFFKLSPKDRMGQTIQYNFDPSLIEIFLSLTQGASLVLTPDNNYSAEKFAQFILDKKITAVALVPSSLRMFLQGLKTTQKTTLRIACCGGEKLDPILANQFLQQTKAQLFNVYGPTEATIIASSWECSHQNITTDLPIGKPADDTTLFVVDSQLNTLPVNELGEIIIVGSTLSQGYLNQDNLTQQAFPYRSKNQSKIYKTGDLGYIGYDGLLYFSGRIDRQVKIGGYRIELGEIEAILQQHKNVNIAAVVTDNLKRPRNIIAFIETKTKDTETLIKELSLWLRQKLPSYMQPQKIIPLTTIKVTSTGKIDYALLPKDEETRLSIIKEKVPPKTLLETQLHQLWQEILPTKTIGIYDNFFELGGDSLSAMSLMVAIEKFSGIRHPLSFLLKNPSIVDQANTLHKKIDNPALITFSNHPNAISIFIAASGHGDSLRLSNLAQALGEQFNVHMLQPPTNEIHCDSIQSIALYYAQIISQQNKNPFYIAGFSIGGITALETARILMAGNNKKPEGLILLDSIYPRWPLQSPWLFKFIQYITKRFNLSHLTISNRHLGVMLNDEGMHVQLNSLAQHNIQSADLPVDLILTKNMWMFHPLILSSWSKLFENKLTRHLISGLHGEMFQPPHLEELTHVIKKITRTQP